MTTSNQTFGIWHDGIAIVRVAMGFMLIFHGWSFFESGNLATFKDLFFNVSIPVSEGLASAAQLIQLIGGALMILGLFNSLSSFVLLATFCVLTFVSGNGRIVSENETTFLFALLSLFFLLTGAGRLSLDHLLTLNRSEDRAETGLAASRKFGRYVSKS